MTRLLLTMCLAWAAVVPTAAASLSGQWSLTLTPDFSGNDDTLGCSFLQDGERLTINCGAGPNIKGEVHGSDVVFRVPTGRSEELTAIFRGKLGADEKTLSGTWELESREGKREGKFSAVKS